MEMEFNAQAERKAFSPAVAGGLSLLLHAFLAAGFFFCLPAGGSTGSAGPLTLSLFAPSGAEGMGAGQPEAIRPSEPQKADATARLKKEGRADVPPREPRRARQVRKAEAQPRQTKDTAESAVPAARHAGEEAQGREAASAENSSGKGSSVQDVPFGRACGPAFTRFIRPSYPLQARRAGISGLVKLRVSLDGKGIVRDIEVLESGHRLLAEAACTAVRRSEFRPYTENGKSLPSRTVIPIRFSLEQAR